MHESLTSKCCDPNLPAESSHGYKQARVEIGKFSDFYDTRERQLIAEMKALRVPDKTSV